MLSQVGLAVDRAWQNYWRRDLDQVQVILLQMHVPVLVLLPACFGQHLSAQSCQAVVVCAPCLQVNFEKVVLEVRADAWEARGFVGQGYGLTLLALVPDPVH